MAIEPEKEIVMILTAVDITEGIVAAIQEKQHVNEPGKGVMFVLDVNKTYGLA
jgi:nitrogen regulatory protein PII